MAAKCTLPPEGRSPKPSESMCSTRKLARDAAQGRIAAADADLSVVAAYGKILPQAVWISSRGVLNVHASLLPKWRGPSPTRRRSYAGDANTGVSIMEPCARWSGTNHLARAVSIGPQDTAGSLEPRLAKLGAEELVRGPSRVARRGLQI